MSASTTSLAARIDLVCQRRAFGERAWCKSAGLSEGYLATQRARESEDGYVLPEKAALRLAAAANINVEWLRFGREPMAPGDGADGASAGPSPDPRHKAVQGLLETAARLHEIGDQRGMAIVMEAIRKLTEPGVTENDEAVESRIRPKVAL